MGPGNLAGIHEWYNGSGYSDGLEADAIPLASRIIAIADAYDALTTDRLYRKGSAKEEALTLLRRDSGSHFDPGLLDIFLATIQHNSTIS